MGIQPSLPKFIRTDILIDVAILGREGGGYIYIYNETSGFTPSL